MMHALLYFSCKNNMYVCTLPQYAYISLIFGLGLRIKCSVEELSRSNVRKRSPDKVIIFERGGKRESSSAVPYVHTYHNYDSLQVFTLVILDARLLT